MADIFSDVKASGGDYTDWVSWEDDLDVGAGGSGNVGYGEGFDEEYTNDYVLINDTTPDGVVMRGKAGERHDHKAGSGCRIKVTTGWQYAVDLNRTFVTIEWMELYSTASNDNGGIRIQGSGSKNINIRNNLIHSFQSNGTIAGITMAWIQDLNVLNNFIWDIVATGNNGSGRGIYNNNGTNCNYESNTIFYIRKDGTGSGLGLLVHDDAGSTYNNNMVIDVDTNCYNNPTPSNATAKNNGSSDASAPGDDNARNLVIANQFVNTSLTYGVTDLALKAGSGGIGTGFDSGTSPTNVNIDIDGVTKTGAWSIGAFHKAVVAGTVIPVIMHHLRQQNIS